MGNRPSHQAAHEVDPALAEARARIRLLEAEAERTEAEAAGLRLQLLYKAALLPLLIALALVALIAAIGNPGMDPFTGAGGLALGAALLGRR